MTKNAPKTQITDSEPTAGATEAKGGDPFGSEGKVAKGRTRRGGNPTPDRAVAGLTQTSLSRDADNPAESATASEAAPAKAASKLDHLVALLGTPHGATLAELASATGWQVHSVRGAMAGALRKKGHVILSEKPESGLRRYRIGKAS